MVGPVIFAAGAPVFVLGGAAAGRLGSGAGSNGLMAAPKVRVSLRPKEASRAFLRASASAFFVSADAPVAPGRPPGPERRLRT